MNELPTPVRTTAPPIVAARDAFDRLTFLGWRWGLAAIVAGMAASFFLFGYALIYWRNADMDFMVIYNALVLNDGKPQRFFDHPAYITILSVKLWFSCCTRSACSTPGRCRPFRRHPTPPAFDAAMTSAVRAGRVLAWLIATGCVLIFAGLSAASCATGASRCWRRWPSHSPAASPCIRASCAASWSRRARSSSRC